MSDVALDAESALEAEPVRDAPPSSVSVPPFSEVLPALVGFLALGASAALGSGDAGVASRGLPSGLLISGGALALTAPALLVGHQYLKLGAAPEAVVAALARPFVRSGELALGLTPAMLFFSATTRIWLGVFALFLVGIAASGLADAMGGLLRAESAVDSPDRLSRDARMSLLVLGWAGLTGLIGVRIAWTVATFTLGA